MRYVLYRWCAAGIGGGTGGRVAFRATGVCPAPPLWLWAQCSLASFPGARVQYHAFHSVALRAVGCCVLLCFHHSGAHWVFRAVAICLGSCSCAPVLCCWSVLVGRLSVLECAFWGFLLLLALLHLFPVLTKRRNSWACTGNPNPVTPIPTIASRNKCVTKRRNSWAA